MVEQCVILIGGMGTRLGDLTKAVPKPLLPVAGKPFLDVLVREASRRGFSKILLLAGHRSDVVLDYMRHQKLEEQFNIRIDISVELEPLGTGGALINALPLLDQAFILLNGDTWFDFNWRDLVYRAQSANALAALALRRVEKPDRYETIEVDGGVVTAIRPRSAISGTALINGGVYYLTRESLAGFDMPASLEADILPIILQRGCLAGVIYSGFFIDIGVPATYDEAQTKIPVQQQRQAVFFDRDGVLNIDHGYVHAPEKLEWIADAREAIKYLNDRGYYVFVVTNQAGVARGYYDEDAVRRLHDFMNAALHAEGAYIDDWRYCPFHPEGTVEEYRAAHSWRKPEPGMLLDLLAKWPVEKHGSFLIGDQKTDLAAAEAAAIDGHLFAGGSLLNVVRHAEKRKQQ